MAAILKRLEQYTSIDHASGCHLWIGPKREGYGRLKIQGKMIGVHRLVYSMSKGEIPSGMLVCHSCDTPACVNPEHLFLGSDKDNSDDKVSKGRQARCPGELNGRAKLTAEQVLRIRNDNRLLKEIAADYGVTLSVISHIKTRRSWKHIQETRQ